LVTACNQQFLPFLEGWLGSVKHHRIHERADLIVFDCGLDQDSRGKLQSNGLRVLDAPSQPQSIVGLPDYYRAMTLRPLLPELVDSSHEFIMWLDADCWIQQSDAIDPFVEVASSRAIACCVEMDRNYSFFSDGDLQRPFEFLQATDDCSLYEQWVTFYERFYPRDVSQKLAAFPLINAGVFCARRSSPLWRSWQAMLDEFMEQLSSRGLAPDPFHRRLDLLADQTALNTSIRFASVQPGYLPPTYNWMCHRALPLVDTGDDGLKEPCWPHEPIRIVHLTTTAMKEDVAFELDACGPNRSNRVSRSLRSPFRVPL
jgi:hypothetical protein